MPDIFFLFLFNPLFWCMVAIALVIVELMAPGYVFVGMAGGAGISALATFFFGETLRDAPAGEGVILVIFAAFALLTWLLLNRFLGNRRNRTTVPDYDIND